MQLIAYHYCPLILQPCSSISYLPNIWSIHKISFFSFRSASFVTLYIKWIEDEHTSGTCVTRFFSLIFFSLITLKNNYSSLEACETELCSLKIVFTFSGKKIFVSNIIFWARSRGPGILLLTYSLKERDCNRIFCFRHIFFQSYTSNWSTLLMMKLKIIKVPNSHKISLNTIRLFEIIFCPFI